MKNAIKLGIRFKTMQRQAGQTASPALITAYQDYCHAVKDMQEEEKDAVKAEIEQAMKEATL